MKRLMIVLLLSGCTTLHPTPPDLSPDFCYQQGVEVDFNTGPMLPVVAVHSMTIGGVHKACEVSDKYPAMVAGCVKPVDGGFAIYQAGSPFLQDGKWTNPTLAHEWCHALYGKNHANNWLSREHKAKRRCRSVGKGVVYDGRQWGCG